MKEQKPITTPIVTEKPRFVNYKLQLVKLITAVLLLIVAVFLPDLPGLICSSVASVISLHVWIMLWREYRNEEVNERE